MLPGAFQPPGPARFFPGAENQELVSILVCPAYLYTLGSLTGTLDIGVTNNLYLIRTIHPGFKELAQTWR